MAFFLRPNGWVGLRLICLSRRNSEDVADFEPFYLKDFIAKKPKVVSLVFS